MKKTLMITAILFLTISSASIAQELVYTIPEKELIPEGIAWDEVTGDFFLGSLNQGRILRIKPDGSYSDFIKPDKKDPMKITGIKVDRERNLLWACVAQRYYDDPNIRQGKRYTGIHKYKLDTGELVDKYYVLIKNKDHLANDLVITANGRVFFTSYGGEVLYKLNLEEKRVEEFMPLKGLMSNGITISPNQRTLYINGSNDIYAIDIKTKKLTKLAAPEGEVLGHADGLYFYKNCLIGMCHQTRDQHYSHGIRQYYLSKDGLAVEKCIDLARDHKDWAIPTTGALVGDQLVFIATSYLGNFKNNKIADPAATKDILLMKVDLK